ncbi:dihydrofolate reductase [Bacillus luteolus]|uniref:Dihydrofolate reductase n=1 Tax=Litchfieldia luteola TaxID=682179 RepID=A0ABR9QNS5_9BACI|nr:dihydrofolate reductase [Cytobacillus luteolus]MBE4910142.1 dihydrofolate reductase [Cytobacillus luteolus]MBP1942294.1 dihydrofolate reductase [Cytobacillus luteolus]
MISLLVAMDNNRLIGKDNDLPWRLPADLAYFKRVTMGHSIIMGRKTFDSIGRPLPGRENIIITRNTEYKADGCIVIHSIEEVLEMNQENKELFIIGGAEIFKEVLPYADRLYITEIDDVFEGDTFFPAFPLNEWQKTTSEKGPRDEKNPYDYNFVVYERISSTENEDR